MVEDARQRIDDQSKYPVGSFHHAEFVLPDYESFPPPEARQRSSLVSRQQQRRMVLGFEVLVSSTRILSLWTGSLGKSLECWILNQQEEVETAKATWHRPLSLCLMGSVICKWQMVCIARIVNNWRFKIQTGAQERQFAAVLKSTGITLQRQKQEAMAVLQTKHADVIANDQLLDQLQHEIQESHFIIQELRAELKAASTKARNQQSQTMQQEMQLEIHQASDATAKRRIGALERQVAQCKEQADARVDRIETEKLDIARKLMETQLHLTKIRSEFAEHLDLQ